MGRGRAKAKQTKVARELKYHTPTTDLSALQRELAGGQSDADDRSEAGTDDDTVDPYGDEDDDDRWPSYR